MNSGGRFVNATLEAQMAAINQYQQERVAKQEG